MTSGTLSLTTALLHSGFQHQEPEIAPESSNETWNMLQVLWDNGTELLAEENYTLLNATDGIDTAQNSNIVEITSIQIVTILICLCGMLGNGIVIWLLNFRIKRNHYSVYILNLAIADFTYVLADIFEITFIFIEINPYLMEFATMLAISSFSVGLNLLMAISIERCVSVLWPIWYKCHRPAHLSTIVCAVIWVLCFSCGLLKIVCEIFLDTCMTMWDLFEPFSILTFLVLIVSSIILLLQFRSFSRRRWPSKLYITILLNVLAFLLLNVPRGIYVVCNWLTFNYENIWPFFILLSAMNSSVNPIIYFFVGRQGQQRSRKSLREVLQGALMDEDREAEQRSGSTMNGQSMTSSEYQEGTVC